MSSIRKYLVSGVMINGVCQVTKVGTLQGGNLSPLLSNIMLNELDKELEKSKVARPNQIKYLGFGFYNL